MATSTLTRGKRFNEIFHILLSHDMAGLLRQLASYGRHLQAGEAAGPNGTASSDLPRRVRGVLEDLGPTFIKIGQLLGTRPDLIPAPFVEEFKKLYDETAPTPFPAIKEVLESELRRPLSEVFESFDEKAIASASIGQVHRATLKGGIDVAVKVQHPNIEDRMRTDFDILRTLVRFTERVFAASRVWQPVEHLEEIRLMLNKELDYRNELRVQLEVEQNFENVPSVKIPHAYADLSSRRVLVMEFIEGLKFRAANQEGLGDLDRRHVAKVITHAMAKMVFIDRLFHADPSPGNLLIISSKQVCFLDFGAFGVVTRRRSHLILDLLMSISAGNHEDIARCIQELCDIRGEYDPKKFLRDVERIADYHEREKASPADPVLLQMVVDTANAHRMVLPADFMLITRALYQFDGMCKALDPDYELVHVLEPFVKELLKDKFLKPKDPMETLRGAALDFAKLATHVPQQLDKILYKLEKGELKTQVEIRGLRAHEIHQMRIVFIIAFTILTGFLLVGSAIGYGLGGAEFVRDYSFLGLAAYLILFLVWVFGSGMFRREKF